MGKLIKQLGELAPELNKEDLTVLAKQTANEIIEGNYDVLRTYIELKRYETYLKELIEATKTAALNVAAEQPTKSFKYHEAFVTVMSRTKWDYAVDDKWNHLVGDIKKMTEQRKVWEEHLQTNFSGDVVDPETGEVIHLDSLPKKVEQFIAIKLD